jgi:hypothetical protein
VLATTEVAGHRLAAVAAAVVLLGASNGLFEVIPRHDMRRNAAYRVTQHVIANTTPEETILVRSDDIAGRYLTYWGDGQVFYVHGEAESLAEILAWVEANGSPPRLWVVDSDSGRADWWDALLESSEPLMPDTWVRSVPDWQPEGSLVLELAPVQRP